LSCALLPLLLEGEEVLVDVWVPVDGCRFLLMGVLLLIGVRFYRQVWALVDRFAYLLMGMHSCSQVWALVDGCAFLSTGIGSC